LLRRPERRDELGFLPDESLLLRIETAVLGDVLFPRQFFSGIPVE
jgi:hypothetical protein